MNFVILSFVIYGVAAILISSTNNNQKIVGGLDANPGQFPYQALIQSLEDPELQICGGSIISNQWILTSGQCAQMNKFLEVRIVVGSIYRNSGGTTHTVLIALEHPDYDKNSDANNIGLIQVNGEISFNDFVQPIRLSSVSTSVGLPLTISGWGLKNRTAEELPNTLQYATMKSISLDECRKLTHFLFPIFDTEVCTYAGNKLGLCAFDDGSPLVNNGQQYAVVTFPLKCIFGFPDINIQVAPFRSWIKNITNV